MKRFIFALFFLFLLLGAEHTVVQVYESDLDTTEWEWHLANSDFELLIGLDEQTWREGISQLYYLDNDIRTRTFDFSAEVPILASLGQRASGGYRINIDQIYKCNQDTIIVVNCHSPQATEYVTTVMTYPYDFVVVPRTALINQNLLVTDSQGEVLLKFENAFVDEERVVEETFVIIQKKEGDLD